MIRAVWTGQGKRPKHPATRAYPNDAGMDLAVSERRVIHPNEFADVPSGVCMELPSDRWGMLVGRSSTLRRRGLFVVTGIIDPGYRGELFAGVYNLSRLTVVLEPGERLAQLILFVNETANHEVEWVDELATSERAHRGFGSSGV